jgi:hypothetical protein
MRAIRVLLAAIVFATVGLVTPAGATSVTTDQSDLWWVPTESGWGIQFVQRGSIIFATMFVYDQTNTPIWYTATLSYLGNFVWTGDLLLTNGPWFGTLPFNPNAVGYRKVGTMTWNATSITNGVLNYGVDGVAVAKNLTRQLLVYDDFSGHYYGGVHQSTTGCVNPGLNGVTEAPAIVNLTQNGQALTIAFFPSGGSSCSYSGALSQYGQMGVTVGSMACSNGETGSFQFFEMQVNISGVSGRFSVSSNTYAGCRYTGWFGGMRGTTF